MKKYGKKNLKLTVILCALTLNLTFLPNVLANSLSPGSLELIANTSNSICGSYLQSGSSKNLEVSGQVTVELNELIKKLIPIGVNGAARFDTDSYSGVLREELATELADIRDCKQMIFSDLIVRLSNISNPDSNNLGIYPLPEIPSAGDITNSGKSIKQWLDVNGEKSKSYEFSLSKFCVLSIKLPERLGWDVNAILTSDNGTIIYRSSGGTQVSHLLKRELPKGTYTFTLQARNGAGVHKAELKASCDD